ncbi:MAG: hypothetical protein H0W76_28750 [Pyrinomonadaceae bacterium]|nr:hypothetical protein [Pyrinomonadaceae bacterium]
MLPYKAAERRHHPPRTHRRDGQVLRMKAALFAVGCMPLFYERAVKRKNNSTVLPTFSAAASPTPLS